MEIKKTLLRAYKFLPSKYALDAITNDRLTISEIDKLNDPFELLPYKPESAARTRLRDITTVKTYGDLDGGICSSYAIKRFLSQEYGILCFCKTFTDPVIWAHYAESHSGICLGFDVPQWDLKDDVGMPILESAEPVAYVDNLLEYPVLSADAERNVATTRHFPKTLIFTKFSNWQYEEEIRMIVPLFGHKGENGLYFYPLDRHFALREVILGCRCSTSVVNLTECLSAFGDVPITRVKPSEENFKMVRDEPSG